jgi:outer membrane biosynthesis protein TonB
MMDKKLTGGAAAVLGAFLYGGAQLLDIEDRLQALEDIHPELSEEEPAEAPAEEEEPEPEEEPEEEEPEEEEPEEEGEPEEE